MATRPEPGDEGSEAAQLLALAVQLKRVAVRADRLDVAARADEAIALVVDANNPIDSHDQKPGSDDKGNAVLKATPFAGRPVTAHGAGDELSRPGGRDGFDELGRRSCRSGRIAM